MAPKALFAQHKKKPLHVGPLKQPTHHATFSSIENGSEVSTTVFAKVDKNTVEFIQFVSNASSDTIACLSFLCSRLEKKPLSEVDNWSGEKITALLELPPKKTENAIHAYDAIAKALHEEDDLDRAFDRVRQYNENYPKGERYRSED